MVLPKRSDLSIEAYSEKEQSVKKNLSRKRGPVGRVAIMDF